MTTTIDDLFYLAEQLGISIAFSNLSELTPDFLGKADAETRTITLDALLKNRPKELKCVLAEEIGHILYPPRPGHIRYHSRGFWQADFYERGSTRAIVAQDERRALDWATSILIPDKLLIQAIQSGIDSIYSLADWFDVEPWLVNLKLNYFIRKSSKISGKKTKRSDIFK